jgi:hypothetical protein
VDRHCDVILVGDSLGNVMHGFETTVPVTLDMMILQGHAVMRGSQHALVVVDMPFGSYEASKEQAFHSAVRILKETHCGAVKLEGGVRMAETVAFLSERGVPVMGHIGLTPQSINTLGSFRAQGPRRGQLGPDPERRQGDFRRRRLFGRDRGGRRAAGAQDHADHRHSDHRHWRQRGLRRAGAGAGGHAGPVAADAEIRSPLRRSRPRDRSGDPGLCQRRALARFPGPEHVYEMKKS